jgi:DNA repair protein RecO
MTKTYQIEAVVLSRRDYGEADRIITLFTKQRGKLTLLAKGVRKLSSKRLGSLEMGTLIKAMAIHGRSMDILSQTVILSSYPSLKQDLSSITRLYQLLEVVDKLTGEDQEHPQVYQVLVDTLARLNLPIISPKQCLLDAFRQIVTELGFETGQAIPELNLKARIETVADRPLKSREFLIPNRTKVS